MKAEFRSSVLGDKKALRLRRLPALSQMAPAAKP